MSRRGHWFSKGVEISVDQGKWETILLIFLHPLKQFHFQFQFHLENRMLFSARYKNMFSPAAIYIINILVHTYQSRFEDGTLVISLVLIFWNELEIRNNHLLIKSCLEIILVITFRWNCTLHKRKNILNFMISHPSLFTRLIAYYFVII